jgi:hypothetical protein
MNLTKDKFIKDLAMHVITNNLTPSLPWGIVMVVLERLRRKRKENSVLAAVSRGRRDGRSWGSQHA